MNNYCIHLKKRENKPFCKLLNKENDRDKIFYQIIRVVEE